METLRERYGLLRDRELLKADHGSTERKESIHGSGTGEQLRQGLSDRCISLNQDLHSSEI